jgi:hypothetical protein
MDSPSWAWRFSLYSSSSPTANASRGLAGTPGIGPGNYFLQPGPRSPKELIAGIKEGLYVTEFLGHGANLVTGDYSRGASGLWVSGANFLDPESDCRNLPTSQLWSDLVDHAVAVVAIDALRGAVEITGFVAD